MLVNDWLIDASGALKRAGNTSAKLDAEIILAEVLRKSRTWLHSHPEYIITHEEQKNLNLLLQRRLFHEPIAYIIGSKEFYGRDFIVSKDVLVPRPETEAMIEMAENFSNQPFTCIDIGTGSGAIAITVALEHPKWKIIATDISKAALKIAKKNAEKLGAKNIVFKTQSLLIEDTEKYDVVLANLPYVPKKLYGKLDIAHEPEIALYADNDGLECYIKLFNQIGARTQKPRHLFTESLIDQHPRLKELASSVGYRLIKTSGLVQYFTC